ncbi:MAG TPA: hypothetical protein VGL95_14745 [Acetobacteraceae bacterium]|jgi:hypothetical protein
MAGAPSKDAGSGRSFERNGAKRARRPTSENRLQTSLTARYWRLGKPFTGRANRMTGENLGPTAPWQIKDFPVELRRRITAAAAEAKLTVGEYLTQFFVGDRRPPMPAGRAITADPTAADLRDMMQAAQAASAASGAPMPKRAARRMFALADNQVRQVSGLPPRKTRHPPARIGAIAPPRVA